MPRPSSLRLRAGPEALAHIQQHGLQAQDITHITAAAGGPKWLILGRLDRYLFGEWLRTAPQRIHTIGASAGAWRMATAAQADVTAAFDRFEQAYIEQRYQERPNAAEVSRQGGIILNALLGENGIEQILAHPRLQLHAVAARCLGHCAASHPHREALGLGLASLENFISRARLARHFERVLIHAPGERLQLQPDAFTTHHVAMTADNARDALMATASIPRVMQRVGAIEGAPLGPYTDGGLIDYHMDLPMTQQPGLILMPHFSSRVTPGWLDKFVPWRRAKNLQRTLLIHPSEELLQRLPNQKIPDRNDFLRYEARDDARIRDWRQAIAESQAMADEFEALIATGRVAERVEPL